MNRWKWWLCAAAALALMATTASAGTAWLESYDEAAKRAKQEDKAILADFTGSDWCGWCVKLKQEVFDTPEFAEWAAKNVVLLEVDFPRKKAQNAQLAAQNKALAAKYEIEGFPTILFLDENGAVLGRSGYVRGGPAAWLKPAQAIIDARAGVRPETSLVQALARARQEGQPLLAMVGGAGLKDGDFKPFYRSPELAGLVTAGVVVVRAAPAAGAAAEEAKALAALTERAGIKGPELHFVLLDSAGQKVLHDSTAAAPDAKTLVPALFKALPAVPYDGDWLESLPQAAVIAAQQNRALLLDFTGSDWCGWCIKLDKEVLGTAEFKAYAKEKLVLVKLDFPKQRELPEKTRQQNQAAMSKYGVRGFPTLLVLDASGRNLGKLGYMAGGPGPFLAKLKELVK